MLSLAAMEQPLVSCAIVLSGSVGMVRNLLRFASSLRCWYLLRSVLGFRQISGFALGSVFASAGPME